MKQTKTTRISGGATIERIASRRSRCWPPAAATVAPSRVDGAGFTGMLQ